MNVNEIIHFLGQCFLICKREEGGEKKLGMTEIIQHPTAMKLCEDCLIDLLIDEKKNKKFEQKGSFENEKEFDIYKQCQKNSDLFYELCWEELHYSGHWSSVPDHWRLSFAIACWIQVLLKLKKHQMNIDPIQDIDQWKELLKKLDLAIMMGGEYDQYGLISRLHDFTEAMHSHLTKQFGVPSIYDDSHVRGSNGDNKKIEYQIDDSKHDKQESVIRMRKKQKISHHKEWNAQDTKMDYFSSQMKSSNTSIGCNADHPMSSQINRVKRIPLKKFENQFFKHQIPVIITNAIDDWPAYDKLNKCNNWSNLNYLNSIAAYRTVPVEIGKDYVSSDWHQKLITFNEFIRKYITSNEEATGYLAQHPLFEQIRALRRDIREPDYCILGKGLVKSVNAWFGPRNTISPLHTDPYDNLLVQVVGSKYIRLYHPQYSHCLYCQEEGFLTNTSKIRNLSDPTVQTNYPMLAQAPFMECELKAGEMLYIPKKHWHYVQSLETSFSVSFWWE